MTTTRRRVRSKNTFFFQESLTITIIHTIYYLNINFCSIHLFYICTNTKIIYFLREQSMVAMIDSVSYNKENNNITMTCICMYIHLFQLLLIIIHLFVIIIITEV